MMYTGNSPVKAVRSALKELGAVEKEIIVNYYFMGRSCIEIGEQLELKPRVVRAARLRSLEKLRLILTPFVERRFGFRVKINPTCPLCRDRRLDGAILECGPHGPWKQVFRRMRTIKLKGLRSVSTIIYHYRNHLSQGGIDEDRRIR